MDVNTFPVAPGATTCTALVPLPNKTLLAAKVVAPVPPLPTATVPEIFAALKSALNTPLLMLKLEPTFTPPKSEALAVGKEKVVVAGIFRVVPDKVAAPEPVVVSVSGAW